MGGSTSRAISRSGAVAAEAAAQTQPSRAQQALDRLPATSAVRRDAERAVQYDEWRIAQEQHLDGIPLEQQSAKDAALETRMTETMLSGDGLISYREHLLPMEATPLCDELTAVVRSLRAL